MSINAERIAFTTDSFVVKPIFFPGGDIAVKWRFTAPSTTSPLGETKPLFISAAFILEEGLTPRRSGQAIVASMKSACDEAGASAVTGDTKVVDRGKGDQIFITTSGIGVVPAGRNLSIRSAQPGRSHPCPPAPSEIMASQSCRSARAWNSKLFWKATRLRWPIDAHHTGSLPLCPLYAHDPLRAVAFPVRLQRTGRMR